MASSPIIGCSSELVTGFLNATFLVPSGARNGGRGPPSGFSRFGTCRLPGVPTNIGLGSLISSGTSLPPPDCGVADCPADVCCGVCSAVCCAGGVPAEGLGMIVSTRLGCAALVGCCPAAFPGCGWSACFWQEARARPRTQAKTAVLHVHFIG